MSSIVVAVAHIPATWAAVANTVGWSFIVVRGYTLTCTTCACELHAQAVTVRAVNGSSTYLGDRTSFSAATSHRFCNQRI